MKRLKAGQAVYNLNGVFEVIGITIKLGNIDFYLNYIEPRRLLELPTSLIAQPYCYYYNRINGELTVHPKPAKNYYVTIEVLKRSIL